MTELAIRARSITKRFGGFTALDNVEFELRPGEIHCLAGENGCGKSTLIKIINGVYQPEPGAQFDFSGQEAVGHITPSSAKRLGIHVIWQDLSLFPDLSVAENICFDAFVANPLRGIGRAQKLERAQKTIEQLGVQLDPKARVGDLSIAKRQLVAICRVIQAEARIVFMDEPTASLTQKETETLLQIVRRLSEQGISIVFVSHRLGEVLDVCERVTVLRDGKLVGTFATEGMTQKKLSTLMTGKELDQTPRAGDVDGERMLVLKHLTRRGEYEDISFDLRKGEILGLTGLMGSGRTEIALSIFGMTSPDSGELRLDGKEVKFRSNRDAIDAGVAYVSEDRLNLGLDQQQSIADNTASTVLKELSQPSFFLNPKRIRELCDLWIEKLKTKVSDPMLPVSSLSGGNQQRIVLAKWLATNPKVLVLDSPTVGVDVGAKAGIFDIIRNLAKEGMAIILISDEASEIFHHTDRTIVLKAGRVAQSFKTSEVSEEELEGIINA
ncbi:sugar ABC transporter ATP-binding protein [Pseudovibrio sp. SPO723]|uniref:sugar ABC transporter ATP-binding protein n=1 Tax=Nesiotobacter zosterae TaxID=392721 RepID=UPI0029C3604B|nr:sugar ABC transporter ATP-binding protein [Pseudovibrio sp. SPO723]MDX5591949.1 sugar ABC transporter ATP-binding protein [Pseudovibrio sp. SPO723]